MSQCVIYSLWFDFFIEKIILNSPLGKLDLFKAVILTLKKY